MINWQSIDTAPKDETVVLLYFPASYDSDGMRVGWWFEDTQGESGWYEREESSHKLTDFYGEPTHWQPLPDPPVGIDVQEVQ